VFNDRSVLAQQPTTHVRARGEPTPFVIAQLEAPPTQLTPKNSVFFDQIRQRLLLPMIQPAEERSEQTGYAASVVVEGHTERRIPQVHEHGRGNRRKSDRVQREAGRVVIDPDTDPGSRTPTSDERRAA
jgi:hypothetical protein